VLAQKGGFVWRFKVSHGSIKFFDFASKDNATLNFKKIGSTSVLSATRFTGNRLQPNRS